MAQDRSGLVIGEDGERRCPWGAGHEDYRRYHDTEWGFPVVDDTRLFEKLCLEGFQSGLSWLTILKKREDFRRAYHGFAIERVARYGARDRARLLADASIIRNRLKVDAAIDNARRLIKIRESHGSFDTYRRDALGLDDAETAAFRELALE